MKTTCLIAVAAFHVALTLAKSTGNDGFPAVLSQFREMMDKDAHATMFEHYHTHEQQRQRRVPSVNDRVLDGLFTSECYQIHDPTGHTVGVFSAIQTMLIDHNYIGPSKIYIDVVVYSGPDCNPSATDVVYKEIMNGTVQFEPSLSASSSGDVGLKVIIDSGYYYTTSPDLLAQVEAQCGTKCDIKWQGINNLVFGKASQCTLVVPVNPTDADLCKRISGTPYYSLFNINFTGGVHQNSPTTIQTQGWNPNPTQQYNPLEFIQQTFNTNQESKDRTKCLAVGTSLCGEYLQGPNSATPGAIDYCYTCDRLKAGSTPYPGLHLECDGCMYRYAVQNYKAALYEACCPCYSYYASSSQDIKAGFLDSIDC